MPHTQARQRIRALAAIAPGLTDIELRALIALEARAEPPEFCCAVSAATLAQETGCSRRRLFPALTHLVQTSVLTRRPGPAKTGTIYRVNPLLTLQMTGDAASPVRRATGDAASPITGDVASTGDAASPITGDMASPVNTQFQLLPNDRPPLDISIGTIPIIDRCFAARPKDFTPDQITIARNRIHGYAAKFPSKANPNPHPPDDIAAAQFLAVAPWPQLEGVLQELMFDRVESGYNWAWFAVVALERIYGISPHETKARRTALKEARRDTTEARRDTAALPAQLAQAMRIRHFGR